MIEEAPDEIIDRLYEELRERDLKIAAMDLEIAKLHYFKMEIQRQASRRRECVDDYVMGAKQAYDDYYNRDPRKLQPREGIDD